MAHATHAPVPKRYNGHVFTIVPPEGNLPRLVMVKVDDPGPRKGKVFRVDRDNTPDWLNARMEVEFLLVSVPTEGGKGRSWIAVDVTPRAE